MPRGDPSNKRFSYTDVSILRQDSAPAHLCMATMHPDQACFLVRGQVRSMLAPAHVSDSTFQRLLSRVSHASYFQASLPMMLKLKAKHAVQPQASHAQMLSTTTCKNMLRAVGVDDITLDSISALKPVLQHTSPTITVNPLAASTGMSQHNVSLPAMLPQAQYTSQQLSQRYGLKTTFASAKLLQLQPLQAQMEAFKAYMTQPINLARGQQKYVSMLTWAKGFETIIHMYLGFCHHIAGVAQPSLEHFLDGNLYAAYTDFLLQRVSYMLMFFCINSLACNTHQHTVTHYCHSSLCCVLAAYRAQQL